MSNFMWQCANIQDNLKPVFALRFLRSCHCHWQVIQPEPWNRICRLSPQTWKAPICSDLLCPTSSCFFSLSLFVALPLTSPPQTLITLCHSMYILSTKWEMLCTIVSLWCDRCSYFCLFDLKTGWPTRALLSIKYLPCTLALQQLLCTEE